MIFRDGIVGYEIDTVHSHYDVNHQLVSVDVSFKDGDVPDEIREFAVSTLVPLLRDQKTSIEFLKEQNGWD